jgi:RNA polymerase sigma factor (TIGR02999 family)
MPSAAPRSLAQLLTAAAQGDVGATDELLPRVYNELRDMAAAQMAAERPGQTLQPTALVNEAYIRLAGDPDARWETRGHFFAAAARAMRRILVERARRRNRRERKNASSGADPALLQAPDSTAGEPVDVVGLDSSLQRLEARDKRKSEIVHLRYFAGLTIEQTAAALGLSITTVKDEWAFAKAWLRRDVRETGKGEP